MEQSYYLTMQDQTKLHVKQWNPNTNPIGIIQIAHGMAEHISRYQYFAEYFINEGFIVLGNDHRGHGKTGEQHVQGFFADEDGKAIVIQDMYEVMQITKKHYPFLPYYFVGHSMGSFLMRNFIQKYSDYIDGLILTGTGHYPRITSFSGRFLASLLPPHDKSRLMNYLAFGNSNRRIPSPAHKYSWLTRDLEQAVAYEDDPLSGYIPTARFFYDLLDSIHSMLNPILNCNIRKDLPLLLLSGDADPIGRYGKGIWKTANIYHKLGLGNITISIFEDGRHELFNDICRDEAFTMINSWLKAYL
ncbi:alpha/beta fold hydrolase [Oceanobacillus kimchii]|uniref:alpha/beta fold hydrolase n=1 Tax=Oceanobacillus kimchii TaxID=746691 RepID=UPI00232DB45A|nr:alpha/beta hydrolase [Oceanobacillus kimchii]